MKKSNSKSRSDCPINYAVELLGDKWSLIVIRDLMFKDKHRYREFLQSKEKIATNILADRLNKLEVNGFITKSVDPDNLKSAIYNLTMKGIELLPTMVEIIKWSAMNDESSALNNNLIAYKGRGTASVIQDIRDKLEDQLVST